jgi:hypothetical protein
MRKIVFATAFLLFCAISCGQRSPRRSEQQVAVPAEAVVIREAPVKPLTRADIVLEKDFLYDQHTLADTFPYNKGVRFFQFDKMRERLFLLDSIQQHPSQWAVLQNNKDMHGRAPLIKVYHTDEYNQPTDALGVERHQSVALYPPDTKTPEYYGRDGSLVKWLGPNADSTMFRIESYNTPGKWDVDWKYVHLITEGTVFTKAVMVDRTNQCIATLEKVGGKWLIRSMNPCTTGAHNPPYGRPTPAGMFVVQEKKPKMLYTRDGSSELAGYAPWASRFSNGGYLHGVPTNNVNAPMIEFSATLGTIPRSHMCVRNATSHAKFIYDWAPVDQTIVFVCD